jgi:PAS domain S-box-containing protein
MDDEGVQAGQELQAEVKRLRRRNSALEAELVRWSRKIAEPVLLMEAWRRLESVAEVTRDAISLIDSGYVYRAANQAYLGALDRDGAHFLGMSVANVWGEEIFNSAILPHLEECFSGRVSRYEAWFEFHGKGRGFYNVSYYPYRDEQGNVTHAVVVTRDITERKQTEENIRGLTRQMISAQEAERCRIARDLHDNLAQELFALKLTCEGLAGGSELSEDAALEMGGCAGKLQALIAEVRDMAYGLRPPALETAGLERTARTICEEAAVRFGFHVDFQSEGMVLVRLDPEASIHILRILQEALRNVASHAGAKTVQVRLVAIPPELLLRVEDDGQGFDVGERRAEALAGKRMGLMGMEERAALLGGALRVESREGKGARITAVIPYTRSKDEQTDTCSDN